MKTAIDTNTAQVSVSPESLEMLPFEPHELHEIDRRVATVKNALIATLLAPSGNTVSGNEVITHINVLVQQPLIILIYKEDDNGNFEYKRHFDYEKAKASRGSLDLRVPGLLPGETFKPDIPRGSDVASLFSVLKGPYYLRIFLLDITGDDQPFYEIPQKEVSLLFLPPLLRNIGRYTQLAVQKLLFFEKEEGTFYGGDFIKELSKKTEGIFDSLCYNNSNKSASDEKILASSRRDKTRVPKVDYQKIHEGTMKIMRSLSLWKEPLDEVYRQSSFAARALKLLGSSQARKQLPRLYPNMIISLRSYTRTKIRAERQLSSGYHFNGYAHDLWYSVSDTQRKDIADYLDWLRREGPKAYQKKFSGERYGEKEWDFKKKPGYGNFASSLDEAFWSKLMHGAGNTSKATNNAHGRDEIATSIESIIDDFCSPFGSGATSMIDAVFYYGASLYRMPFRRLGGLARLHDLELVYEKLSDGEKLEFSFEHIRAPKYKELRRDCFRVVTLFYITRMLGPTCFDLLKHYTKIHIYPIDINGAIIGAIGKVSFQAIDPSQKKIPTSTQDWNREYFFYAEVVWSVQNAIRRHYRELHLKLSAKAIRRGLGVLFDGREISRDRLAEFVDDLNISARDIARLCPHPAHEFFLVGRSAKIKPHGFGGDGWFKADLDDRLAIGFRRNKDWEVFRSMTLPGSKYVVEEHSRALQGKLQEEILAAINRPSVTNVYSIATKKVTS